MNADQNSPERRLRRVETRLTNLGRLLGFDLTVPPPPNVRDSPVFISNEVIYVTPSTTMADLAHAVLRYRAFKEGDREVPIVMNRRVIATIDPLLLRDPEARLGEANGAE